MVIRVKGGSYYVNGPFAQVHKNMDIFNSNIYFSYLMTRTLMDEVDAQQFYAEAIEMGDEDIIKEAEKDMAHLENAFKKACLLMTHFDGISA
tara:strand:+ start:6174 stop:6449 length:276 start_codon:yes stop_codon:yes gene_type:complete